MTKVKAAGINADALKSFVERIEKLVEERKALGGDIKDVFSEAKGVGYDVPTIRKVVALRAMDAADRDEMETLIDVYMHALSAPKRAAVEAMQKGAGTREAARAAGIAVGAASQLRTGVHGIENGEHVHEKQIGEHHDPETGEIGEASQDAHSRPATSDCGLTAATALLGSPEREARPPTNTGIGIPDVALAIGLSEVQQAGINPSPQDHLPDERNMVEADQPAVVGAIAAEQRVASSIEVPEEDALQGGEGCGRAHPIESTAEQRPLAMCPEAGKDPTAEPPQPQHHSTALPVSQKANGTVPETISHSSIEAPLTEQPYEEIVQLEGDRLEGCESASSSSGTALQGDRLPSRESVGAVAASSPRVASPTISKMESVHDLGTAEPVDDLAIPTFLDRRLQVPA